MNSAGYAEISVGVRNTHWAILACFAVLFPIAIFGLLDPTFQLVGLAACLLGVSLFPLLGTRRIEWFSIWNMLCYSIVVGVFLRSFYITFDFPDREAIDAVFLWGRTKDFLVRPMIVLLGGMIVVTAGYLLGPHLRITSSHRLLRSDSWDEKRFWSVALGLQLLSWLGISLFIVNTTGFEGIRESLSALRGVSLEISEYRSFSYYRVLASLSDIVCYLMVARISSRQRADWLTLVLLAASLGSSLFFSFFVSARGLAVFLLLNLMAIRYYLAPARTKLSGLVLVCVLGLLLVRVLSNLRQGEELFDALDPTANLLQLAEPVVLTTNLIDVSKTGHILDAIPNQLDYQWGKTLITVLVAWIPREMWPEKPVTNVDNLLGMTLYGYSAYGSGGLPPGLVAEMYWNFSYAGVLVGCFALGSLLKATHSAIRDHLRNKNMVLIYVVCLMPLGVSFMGSSFTSVIIGLLTSFLPLWAVLSIITRKTAWLEPAGAPELRGAR